MLNEKLLKSRNEEIEIIEKIGDKYKMFFRVGLLVIISLLFFYFDKNIYFLSISFLAVFVINIYYSYWVLLKKQNEILRVLKTENVKTPIQIALDE